MNETSQAQVAPTGGLQGRWAQLIIGIICMAFVANLQYGWTLFVKPMHQQMHWAEAGIQLAFSIFIVVETWLVPIEGWLVDKFGPRPVVAGGAVCVALSWIMNSYATALPVLYVSSVIAGIGAGCVYGTCVGNALKWFPDKRGLAAGLTAAGFGAGAAATVIPIANMIKASGYQHTFFTFGIIQGVAIFIMAMFLVRPRPPVGKTAVASKANVQGKRDYSPSQMMKTPVFWLTYIIFVAVAAGGLMATAQIGPMAKDFGIDKAPILILGTMMPLLTLTMSIDNLANGFTRPLCGLISDRFGRENTMFLVFLGEGLALLGLMKFGHTVSGFLLFAPLVFLFWGEIFSIFPAITGDTFGSKFAAGNAGTMYTAKGTASLLVPLGSLLKASTGSWNSVIIAAAVISIVAAIAARVILAPMRRRFVTGNIEAAAVPADTALSER